eukprot:m51a1_g14200 putative ubiquitin ligase (752) ;mRNA; r:138249-141205
MNGAALQEQLKQIVSLHYKSITEGCGNASCTNPYCRSSANASREIANIHASTAAAFALSVRLARSNTPLCASYSVALPPSSSSSPRSPSPPASAAQTPTPPPPPAPPGPPPFRDLAEILELARTDADGLTARVRAVFASPALLARSFVREGDACVAGEVAPVVDDISDVYQALAETSREALTGSSHVIVSELRTTAERGSPDAPRAILLTALNPLMWEWDALAAGTLESLLEAAAVLQPVAARSALVAAIARLPKGEMVSLLHRAQTALSMRVVAAPDASSPNRDAFVIASCKFLALISEANVMMGAPVPFTQFYNSVLTEKLDLRDDYILWIQRRGGGGSAASRGSVSMLEFPWVLDAAYKRKAMQIESLVEQRTRRQDVLQHMDPLAALFGLGMNPQAALSLPIRVRRENLIQDSLDCLVGHDPSDFKLPIRVEFSGEAGLDHGGVQKEWFQLVIQSIFDPMFGMFVLNERTRTFWFNPNSDSIPDFKLIGILLGLAIYNNAILNVHFPKVVYKKLLSVRYEPELEDLEDVYPDMRRSLQKMLEPGFDVDELGLTFTVEYEYYGSVRSLELKPGGASVAVTRENKAEYVRLRLHWVLVDSVEKQFSSFREGFKSVISDSRAMGLFKPEELELVICGSPELDFQDMERHTHYEGYEASDQVIRWFWEVIHSLTLEQKRLFLAFTTGTDRCPIGGLKDLRLIVGKHGDDPDQLPTASTCFNYLHLPAYDSKEKLRDKLLQAIENCTGFGLA